MLLSGYVRIAGVDEVGRGCLCGPVVAAAVILPIGLLIDGVTDSKKLTAGRREKLFARIKKHAAGIGVGCVSARDIDRINILEATRKAMLQAVRRMDPPPDCLLIDAVRLPDIGIPQNPIIRGDLLSHSISAASIIAKVIRDRLMAVYGRRYPEYGLSKNMGYGSRQHVEALRIYGPSPIHRLTFRKVRDCRCLFPD